MSSLTPRNLASQPLASRTLTGLLRLPHRAFPIPGWFPLVVDRLHPLASPPSSRAEVEIAGRRMELNLDDYVQRRIYYGCHEPREIAFLRRALRPGDVVLDVGAHVGYFTVIAASVVGPTGAVHAFEPVPANFAALERNVSRNGFSHVVLNRVAVAGESGEMSLGIHPDRMLGSGATNAMYSKGGSERALAVPVVTLDDYVEDALPGAHIRLAKLDVEGLEGSALDGFQQTLRARPPDCLMLEVNPDMLTRHQSSVWGVVNQLVARHYSVYRMTAAGRLKEWTATDSSANAEIPSRIDRLLGRLVPHYDLREAVFNVIAIRRGKPGPVVR